MDISLTSTSSADLRTLALESIKVGQRVLAKNPETGHLERRTRRAEPDFGRWLQLSLELPKPDGSTLHIEMLRSEEWLQNPIGFVVAENPGPSGERLGVSPPCAIEDGRELNADVRARESEISDFKTPPCDFPNTSNRKRPAWWKRGQVSFN
ncbi:MAG: hypothetical protein U0936_13165 [Planctomycetaceae bacterium]